MYSENPSGNSMNTATAARFGATNARPRPRASPGPSLRRSSSSCQAPRRRRGTAPSERCRRADATQHRSEAAVHQCIDLLPRRGDRQIARIGRAAGEHVEIADVAVRLARIRPSRPRTSAPARTGRLTGQRLADRAGRELDELPGLFLAAAARRDGESGGADIGSAPCPGGPDGSTVMSKSRPSARENVWYRQCPPIAIAAFRRNRSIVDMDC